MEKMAGKDKNTPFPTFFCPLLRFLYACRQIETAQLSASPTYQWGLTEKCCREPASNIESVNVVRFFRHRLAFSLFMYYLCSSKGSTQVFPFFWFPIHLHPPISWRRTFPACFGMRFGPNEPMKRPLLDCRPARMSFQVWPFCKVVWAEWEKWWGGGGE